MSQHAKLLHRLLGKPKTWDELRKLLKGFGYEEVPGSGSRRRFVHNDRAPIILHQPHPGNELKSYQVAQIITHLKMEGHHE
jgi:predicted RNA binding protein YcfA (HicA-like mRNA interferase family)